MPDSKDIAYKTPFADWETRAFWEGAGRHELVLQRCMACDTVQHRPRAICATCLSSEVGHFVASGQGTVYSYTITHQNGLPGFRDAVPYVLAYVDLEEGPRLMTNIVGCAPDEVSIGMAVRVDFVDTEDQLAVPRFVPA